MLQRSVFRAIPFRSSVVRCASNYVVLGSADSFKTIMETEGPKILYFTATWCPPCKKIAPVFEKLSKDFSNTTFVKIDIDDNRELAEEHRISSVPTFKAFSGSKLLSQVIMSLILLYQDIYNFLFNLTDILY